MMLAEAGQDFYTKYLTEVKLVQMLFFFSVQNVQADVFRAELCVCEVTKYLIKHV